MGDKLHVLAEDRGDKLLSCSLRIKHCTSFCSAFAFTGMKGTPMMSQPVVMSQS